MTLTMVRRCSKCDEILPISAFEWRPDLLSYRGTCRYCRADAKRTPGARRRTVRGGWKNLIENCNASLYG